jgi:hypothetical protein
MSKMRPRERRVRLPGVEANDYVKSRALEEITE